MKKLVIPFLLSLFFYACNNVEPQKTKRKTKELSNVSPIDSASSIAQQVIISPIEKTLAYKMYSYGVLHMKFDIENKKLVTVINKVAEITYDYTIDNNIIKGKFKSMKTFTNEGFENAIDVTLRVENEDEIILLTNPQIRLKSGKEVQKDIVEENANGISYNNKSNLHDTYSKKRFLPKPEFTNIAEVFMYLKDRVYIGKEGNKELKIQIDYTSDLGSWGVIVDGETLYFNLDVTVLSLTRAVIEGMSRIVKEDGTMGRNTIIYVNSVTDCLTIQGQSCCMKQ